MGAAAGAITNSVRFLLPDSAATVPHNLSPNPFQRVSTD